MYKIRSCKRGIGIFASNDIYIHKSPDEWATTKQVCMDELVAYLSFSSHNIYIYIYIFFFFNFLIFFSFASVCEPQVVV